MCCGSPTRRFSTGAQRLTRIFAAPPPRETADLPAQPVFEYTGATALTVVSPVTRRTYRFERSGARLEADPRDRSWLAFVPNLVRVGAG